ncbi:MAG: CBS domain-containing protein [Candidatus Aenigmarchaeota archaeon]|nr:CBS domain-containing protein [Candidatus Aenigmarchaeota archaeon]
MKVKDIMVRNVVTLSPDDTFFDIVELFAEKKISGAPVVEGEKLVGMVSESDIMEFVSVKNVMKLIEKGDEALKGKTSLKAKDFMTKKVITVSPKDDIIDVVKLLDTKDINRLPVTEKGKVVGIITRADVVSVVSEYLTEHPAMRKRELETDEPKLETSVDILLSLAKQKNAITFKEAAKELKVDENMIEQWAKILEDYKLVKINYPPLGEPKIKFYREKKHGKK